MWALTVAVLYFFVTAYCVNLSDEQSNMIKTFHNECAKESMVSDEVMESARKGNFPDDPKFKAHLFCIQKKTEFISPSGVFQKPRIIERLTEVYKDRALVATLVEKCAVSKTSPEESAFNFSKCSYENSPDPVIFY